MPVPFCPAYITMCDALLGSANDLGVHGRLVTVLLPAPAAKLKFTDEPE